MKNSLIFLVIITGIVCSQAQSLPLTNRPEWKVTFQVVGEDGKPIAGADTKVGYYVKPPSGQSVAMESVQGKTDTNGVFMATGRSQFMLSCSAKKDGYYTTALSYELGLANQYDPVKWNPTLKLELKKIGSPIPMYAKRIHGLAVTNKPVGFDLVVGDWVFPHGKGRTADAIFTKNFDMKSSRDYESKIILTFPNRADGIQEFQVSHPLGEGSKLRSPHEAPEGGYQNQLIRENSAHPGQPANFDYDQNRNYFIRVRTVTDQQGNMKSAYYGKIYGDLMQFSYYLNPTPNSRNIEFDPKQNLLTNLKSTEGVDAP